MHSPKSQPFVQLLAGFVVLTPIVSRAPDSAEQKNMELVGRSDLNGNFDGGEGVNKWPLFTALLSLIVLPGFVRSALPSQSSSPSSPPMYSAGPVTDYNLALPNSGDVIQFRRGERYNIPDTSVAELGENSEARLWTLPSSHFKKDPMPFASSDGVVV
jgi:hypothetical protein